MASPNDHFKGECATAMGCKSTSEPGNQPAGAGDHDEEKTELRTWAA